MAEELGMPPPPQKGGMGSVFKHKVPPPSHELSEMKDDINSVERRLKVLEESFTNIRRSLQVAEQNMLSKNKIFSTEIRTLTSEIDDIKKEISDIKEKIMMLIKELGNTAKINDVKILEKYINLWDPIKFATRNEVERIIDEKLKNK
jgi:DNA repair exonuclease SbcCD ATPase subunit